MDRHPRHRHMKRASLEKCAVSDFYGVGGFESAGA